MDILSKTPERLKELMFDKGINAPKLAKDLHIGSNSITRCLSGKTLPKFHTFVAIITYFNCSADFLLGLNDYPQTERNYLPCPPFQESFRNAMQACGFSQYELQKQTNISWSNFHFWLNGIRSPYLDNLVKIAQTMDCSVDFLIGRVK